MKEELYILLLEKEAAGELSDSEKTDLKNWLAASAENSEQAAVYRKILKSSSGYSKPINIDIEARFKELESKLDEPQSGKVRQMPPRFNWMRVAATFALLIGSFFAWQHFSQPTELQWVSTEIAEGELEVFTFSDQSKMTLRGGSKIEYPEEFLGAERRVKLSGEAFFEVEKDATIPFIVELENGQVRVLGTSFNIDSKSGKDEVTVFVKTGRVQFSVTAGEDVILTKNEAGVLNKKENSLNKIAHTNENEISWMTRKLNFESTALSEVVENLSDLYGSKIQIENEELFSCPLDLSFENEDLKSVLETIADVFGMEISQNENELLLKGGSCN